MSASGGPEPLSASVSGPPAPPRDTSSSTNDVGLDTLLPTRALPTPLSEDYAAYLRVVMKDRKTRLWVLSGFGISASLVALNILFAYHRLLVLPIVLPIICFAPALIRFLRYRYSQVSPMPYSTRLSHALESLRLTSHPAHVITYLSFSTCILIGYIIAQDSKDLLPIGYLPGRDVWQVGEGFCYISWSTIVTSMLFASMHIWESRDVVSVSRTQFPVAHRVYARTSSRLPVAICISLISQFVSLFVYIMARNTALHFILDSTPIGPFIRPHLFIFFRRRYLSLNFAHILGRTVVVNLLIGSSMEITNCLCDVYYTQPIMVSHFSNNPNKCLLNGLRDQNKFVQQFAFHELASIANEQPERRMGIFKDIRSSPPMLCQIFRECLTVLGKSYKTILPGIESIAPTTPPQSSNTRSVSQASAMPKMSADNVFQHPKRSTFEGFFPSLFSTSSSKPAINSSVSVSSGAGNVKNVGTAPQQQSPIPAVFQVNKESDSEKKASQSSSSTKFASGSSDHIEIAPTPTSGILKLVPLQIRQTRQFRMCSKPLISGKIAGHMTSIDRDICAIQALAWITVASLEEDAYGFTQREIPKVLESFTKFSDCLDSYVASLRMIDMKNTDGARDDVEGTDAIDAFVLPVSDTLKENTLLILKTFEPFIKDFRFPPSTAKKLQETLDYSHGSASLV